MKIKSFRKPVLAVQWDPTTVDYLLAERKAGTVRILAAGTVPLTGEAESSTPAEEVAKVLAECDCRRPDTLVALNRSQVDVLPLQLPPAGDDELPELVANQVVRDAGELAESGVIDFVPLAIEEDEGRHVFAFVADADALKQVKAECEAAGVKLVAVLYRPLAAAHVLRRMMPHSPRTMILISRHDQEADLSIVRGQDLLYTRTARIGTVDETARLAELLSVEVRRTLAAASLAPDPEGQHVYVFGSLAESQELVEQLADDMDLPVSLLDPLRAEVLEGTPPAQVGRIAPLLGMVHEYYDGAHAVDFLHPKQPPPPPNYWYRVAKIAALLAVLVGMAGYYAWDRRAATQREVNDLRADLDKVSSQLARVQRKQAVVTAIEQWDAETVNWLDELYDLTRRFPPGDEALVRRLTAGPGRGGSGVVDMAVRVRTQEVVSQLDDRLRDSFHDVRNQRVSEQQAAGDYPWAFDTRISLQRRDADQYRQSAGIQPPGTEVPVSQPITPDNK